MAGVLVIETIAAILAGSLVGTALGTGLAVLIIKFFEWVFE